MPLTPRTIGYLTIVFLLAFLTGTGLYLYFTEVRGWGERIAFADDIGNLKKDNPVKVGGVAVGQVRRISREGNQAKLVLRMRESIRIRRDYALLNMDVGLMGDRVLVLLPGDSGDVLPFGEPLKIRFVTGIAEGIRNADQMGEVVLSLKELVGRYARVDPANDSLFTTQFFAVLKALDKSTRSLETMITEREDVISRAVKDIHALSRGLKKEVREARPKAQAGLDGAMRLSLETGKLLNRLEPLVGELDTMISDIDAGKGPAGVLANDKKMYNRLIAAIETIRRLISTLKEEGAALDVDVF